MKKAQEIRFKFNSEDESEICKAVINIGATNVLAFKAHNIWLNDLNEFQKKDLVRDIKEYAYFLLELAEEVDR